MIQGAGDILSRPTNDFIEFCQVIGLSIIKSKRYIKKLGIVGDSSVGKTSMIRRFVVDVFDDRYVATIGAKVTKRDMEYRSPDRTVYLTLMLWDILGQKDYKKIRAQSMNGAHGMIITADMTRPETVKSAEEFWFKEVRSALGNVPIVLVGNKMDMSEEDSSARDALTAFGEKIETPVLFCSAKTGDNVGEAFRKIGEMMISGDFARKAPAEEGECGSLSQAVDEIVNDFCEQHGDMARAMEVIEREFRRAEVNIQKPVKEAVLMAIEYLSDVERDIHGRDVSEVNKLRRWKMIDEAL
jgi:Ras-related protein Rab-5C